ncbi:MAG TPA: hypothetical protein VFX59_27820 [Polyangiales bacterium]|nr:hypothetical protein [Polyangiales bacterium]
MSELSSDAKALIERARLDDAPRAEDKARNRERLAAQLGAGAFAGAALLGAGSALEATIGKSGAAAKSTLLRWLAGTVAASGIAVGTFLIASPKDSPKASPVVAIAPAEPPAPTPAPAPAPAPTLDPPAPPSPAVAARRAHKRALAPAFAPVGNTGSMNAEITLLAQAQKALRARDGKGALRLARQHAENFPSGALYEERVGIEAIAHCVLGERDHPAVRAFLVRSPRSPLSARVRKECAVP